MAEELLIKEDENVLRSIVENTPEEDQTYEKDITKEKILPFIGLKVGKIYKDLMAKLNILKLDIYTLYTNFQDFLEKDKDYKDANDLEKINIQQSINNFKTALGNIDDFKNNLN